MADARPPADDSLDTEPPSDPTASPNRSDPDTIPWGQRFFDRPFVLLFLGLLIMAVFFTGWGLWEITSLPPAPLP
jgi:hypothetical protein